MNLRHAAVLTLGSFVALGFAGCTQQEEITRYQVPKPHVVYQSNHVESATGPRGQRPQEPTDRMLAAMIPRGEQTWFFKVTGPMDAVAEHADQFRALVQSVRFDGPDASQPTWTLPEGWRQESGSELRFATLKFGDERNPLEVSITPLATGEGSQVEYVLANVNRWRRQLQLPPIGAAQLDKETEQIELDGGTATLVNLVGNAAAGGMGRAPFAGGAARPSPLAPPEGAATLSYKTPEGWTEGQAGGFRKAAFKVSAGDKSVEITAIDLAESAGEVLANVNRWRGQVKLGPVTQEQLDAEVQTIQVDGRSASYVELVGPEDAQPRETILGVIVLAGGKSWFFKLRGDAELAQREKENFEAFVKSIQFTRGRGSGP